MTQAAALCAEMGVLRSLVQPKPPNQPSLTVTMTITAISPRWTPLHGVQN